MSEIFLGNWTDSFILEAMFFDNPYFVGGKYLSLLLQSMAQLNEYSY